MRPGFIEPMMPTLLDERLDLQPVGRGAAAICRAAALASMIADFSLSSWAAAPAMIFSLPVQSWPRRVKTRAAPCPTMTWNAPAVELHLGRPVAVARRRVHQLNG